MRWEVLFLFLKTCLVNWKTSLASSLKKHTDYFGRLIDFTIKCLKVPDVINAFKANCYFSGN
jgi:hypothetical protein